MVISSSKAVIGGHAHRNDNNNNTRTAALRSTNATGYVTENARSDQTSKTGVADHWEAWREIQIQHEQSRTIAKHV